MTKEEAKHLSNILKAYAEGKKIERLTFNYAKNKATWIEISDTEPLQNYLVGHDLRIKEE